MISGGHSRRGQKAQRHFSQQSKGDIMEKPTGIFASGRRFFVGCNYWASHAGTAMWRQWQPETVEADLALLQKNRIETLRVFPLWPDFQPLVRETRWCQTGGELRLAGGLPRPATAARRAGGRADRRAAAAALRAAGPAARPAPLQNPPKTTKGASPFPERLLLFCLFQLSSAWPRPPWPSARPVPWGRTSPS